MFNTSRRELLRGLAAAVAGAGSIDSAAAQHVHQLAADDLAAAGVYKPKGLTAHEFSTLERLTDLILPAEGSKPGAVASGAAAWIDMLVSENAELSEIYTGGLAALDNTTRSRTGKDFLSASPTEQTALLDLIAYRKNESRDLGANIHFFEWARRMTVDAFYTSKVGIQTLDYRGNTALAKYEVPAAAIDYAWKKSGLA
jgi:gluconate 2-dehydrogenase gamma chain